jgi:hypothetical protein
MIYALSQINLAKFKYCSANRIDTPSFFRVWMYGTGQLIDNHRGQALGGFIKDDHFRISIIATSFSAETGLNWETQ